MSLLSDLKGLKQNEIVILFIIFFSLLAPGAMIIYHYNPELFLKIDFWKLAILSTSITIPSLVFNIFFIPTFFKTKQISYSTFIFGSFCTSMIYYSTFILAYFFKFNFKIFCITIIGLQIVFFIVASLKGIMESRKLENNK